MYAQIFDIRVLSKHMTYTHSFSVLNQCWFDIVSTLCVSNVNTNTQHKIKGHSSERGYHDQDVIWSRSDVENNWTSAINNSHDWSRAVTLADWLLSWPRKIFRMIWTMSWNFRENQIRTDWNSAAIRFASFDWYRGKSSRNADEMWTTADGDNYILKDSWSSAENCHVPAGNFIRAIKADKRQIHRK